MAKPRHHPHFRQSRTAQSLILCVFMNNAGYPGPPEFVAQGDRVLVIGVATGKIKATNKAFKDEWVFDITVRDGKLTRIQEYIDTQALARAS